MAGTAIAISPSGNMIGMSQREDHSDPETYNNGLIKTYALTNTKKWVALDEIVGTNSNGVSGPIAFSDDGLTMLIVSNSAISRYQLTSGKWEFQYEFGGQSTIQNEVTYPDLLNPSSARLFNFSMSANAKIVAVAYDNGPGSGRFGEIYTSIRLFRMDKDSVTQIGSPLYGEVSRDSFGQSMVLNCDGSLIVTGGHRNDDSKAYVRAFRNIDDEWHQLGDEILFDQQGLTDIAISADGTEVVIGAGTANTRGYYGQVQAYRWKSDQE